MSFNNWNGIIDQNHKDIDGDLSKWHVGPRIGLFPANDYPAFNYLLEESGVGFQINNAWELANTPSDITLNDFEKEVKDLQLTTNLQDYRIKLDSLAEIWMEELLYYIPLLSTDLSYFSSPNLSKSNYQNGLLRSIFTGLKWDTQPSVGDPTTLNIAREMFTMLNEMTTPDYSTLVMFDENLQPHPDLAIQWENNDWVKNETHTFKNGIHKFVIRDDAYWYQPFPSRYFNFTAQTHKISAKDFAFAFDLNKPFWVADPPIFYPLSTDITQRENYALFHSYSLNETENSISYFTEYPSVMDLSLLSRASPIPEFYFNRTIVFNDILNGTPAELMEIGAHPFFSDTFNEFWRLSPLYQGLSWSGTGISSGPYAITNDRDPVFKLRDDYWYPNEWDSPGGDFIVHEPGSELDKVKYNVFNDTENTQQKPTKYFFDILNYNTPWFGFNLSSIETREADIFPLIASDDLNSYDDLLNSPSVDQQFIRQKNSGETLWFDFENNEDIRKYNVRRAIAYAINKPAVIESLGGYATSIDSPIFLGHQQFYKPDWRIEYDYREARDLMRNEGYEALEDPFVNPKGAQAPTTTIFVPNDDLSISLFMSIFGLLVYRLISRRKINDSK
jgi:hypothetical protein